MKKSARNIKDEASAPGEGAVIIAGGKLPSKLATATAEVLARLLAGERLTSIDGVHAASTTRLAAVTHYLANEYGWAAIESVDKAAGCRDGRVSYVAEYALPPAVRAAAMAAGAEVWCADVRRARAALRARAATATRQAARINAARAAGAVCPGQWGLFEQAEPMATAGREVTA